MPKRSKIPIRVRAKLWRYARKAHRHGCPQAWTIIAESYLAGVPLSLGLALFQHESAFRNVFGHDPTIYAGAGIVTRAKYLAYRLRRRNSGNRLMQGVGPGQLTWWATQDYADRLGGCHVYNINCRVALRTLAANIKENGYAKGVERYNGSGDAARRYSADVRALARGWHARLT